MFIYLISQNRSLLMLQLPCKYDFSLFQPNQSEILDQHPMPNVYQRFSKWSAHIEETGDPAI